MVFEWRKCIELNAITRSILYRSINYKDLNPVVLQASWQWTKPKPHRQSMPFYILYIMYQNTSGKLLLLLDILLKTLRVFAGRVSQQICWYSSTFYIKNTLEKFCPLTPNILLILKLSTFDTSLPNYFIICNAPSIFLSRKKL